MRTGNCFPLFTDAYSREAYAAVWHVDANLDSLRHYNKRSNDTRYMGLSLLSVCASNLRRYQNDTSTEIIEFSLRSSKASSTVENEGCDRVTDNELDQKNSISSKMTPTSQGNKSSLKTNGHDINGFPRDQSTHVPARTIATPPSLENGTRSSTSGFFVH